MTLEFHRVCSTRPTLIAPAGETRYSKKCRVRRMIQLPLRDRSRLCSFGHAGRVRRGRCGLPARDPRRDPAMRPRSNSRSASGPIPRNALSSKRADRRRPPGQLPRGGARQPQLSACLAPPCFGFLAQITDELFQGIARQDEKLSFIQIAEPDPRRLAQGIELRCIERSRSTIRLRPSRSNSRAF